MWLIDKVLFSVVNGPWGVIEYGVEGGSVNGDRIGYRKGS
jgi:hypothetical protein